MKIDLEQIRVLLAAVAEADISELVIECGDEKVCVKKAAVARSYATNTRLLQPHGVPESVTAIAVQEKPPSVIDLSRSDRIVPITAPMVGTFYRSSSPSAPSFVEVGDVVTEGQPVCIIEAMKLMNDLISEVAGRIVQICVANGTTVEYGQPLFMVDPEG